MATINHSSYSDGPKIKTRKKLAGEYGITPKTLNARIKKAKLNIPPGCLFPNTLAKIYMTLGKPTKFNRE